MKSSNISGEYKVHRDKNAPRSRSSVRDRANLPAYLASIGQGNDEDLAQVDKFTKQLSELVDGGSFDNIQDAYKYIEDEQIFSTMPSLDLLQGRVYRRLNNMLDNKVITPVKYKELRDKFGITDREPISKPERFQSGLARSMNNASYFVKATGSALGTNRSIVGNAIQNFFEKRLAPDFIQDTVKWFNNDKVDEEPMLTEADASTMEEMEKIFQAEEDYWKGSNAEVQFDKEGGVDQNTLNLAGGLGENAFEFVLGGGVGTLAKKTSTQLVGDLALSSVFNTGGQMTKGKELSAESIGKDLLLNTVLTTLGVTPAMLGTKGMNIIDPTSGQRGLEQGQNLSATQSAHNANKLKASGDLEVPVLVTTDGKQAVKELKAAKTKTDANIISDALDTGDASMARVYDESLDKIGVGKEALAGKGTGGGMDADPVANLAVEELNALKKQFKSRAQPFTDAYSKAGNDIDVTSELEGIIKKFPDIKDNEALAKALTLMRHLVNQKTVNGTTKINANDLDVLTQQMGTTARNWTDGMGRADAIGQQEINEIYSSLKGVLNNLDPSFSDPYKKAKSIYADMYQYTGDKTKIGNVKQALEHANQDGNLHSVRALIDDKGGFLHNMDSYSYIFDNNNPAFKEMMREGFEKLGTGVRGSGAEQVFKYNKMGEQFADIDWESYLKYLPKDDQAREGVENLSGLQYISKGMQSEGGDVLTDRTKRIGLLDKSTESLVNKPLAVAKDLISSGKTTLPITSNWWEDMDVTLGATIANSMDKLRAPLDRRYIPKSAEVEAQLALDRLNELRRSKGMSELGQSYNKSMDGKAKLYDENFDFFEDNNLVPSTTPAIGSEPILLEYHQNLLQ